jgi:hypothetical protein
VNSELKGERLVYGDFSNLLNLKVSGDMYRISETYRELRNLDKSLYVGFVTYILARAGYCNKTICEKWRIAATFYEEDNVVHNCSVCPLNPQLIREEQVDWTGWIQCSFAWAEELNELWDKYGEAVEHVVWDLLGFFGTWSHYYENQVSRQRLKIIFTHELPLDQPRSINDLKKWQTLSAIDPSCSNYILVDPATFKRTRRDSAERLKNLHDLLLSENILLVSVDEFADKFISRDKKDSELENWISVRNQTLEHLLKKNPILVIALEWEKLNDVEVHLKASRQEYENAATRTDFEHAIRDATYACEALLQILYHKYFGREAPSNFTWDDLLNSLEETIKSEFITLVYSDLKFLQNWRNYVSHPKDKIPVLNRNIAFQVVNRSQAFYESVKASLNQFELPNI